MGNRDNFTESTKRTMAERVAWRCSFPNCGKITIGPRMGESNKSLNLGEAAHIIAAAEFGPRFDKKTTSEYRKSIENGIWMCRAHARFIDSDHKEYSIETLQLWKSQAEDQAYKDLQLQDNYKFTNRATLISIGFDLLFYGEWKSVNKNEWSFLVHSYLKGTHSNLKAYADNFQQIEVNQRFIAVESQGDARILADAIELSFSEDGSELITVQIQNKVIASEPAKMGSTIKLGDDGDLDFSKGGLQRISGIDAAIQSIQTSAGVIYGESVFDRTMGSFITKYFIEYQDDLPLLEKIVKLELIRLSLISRKTDKGDVIKPPLGFIKEIVSVSIPSVALDNSRLSMNLTLVLGNETEWSGTIKTFVLKT
jgi:hypothetical protein